MSRNRRYRRDSPERTLADVHERLGRAEAGNPRPTFRAAITDQFATLTSERRAYEAIVAGSPGAGDTDTVFWDYWWDDYDRKYFDPFIQPSGPDIGRIGAVELLMPGIYAIRATIDWENEDFTLLENFNTWIGSNYDDGGLEHIYMPLNSAILGTWTLSQHRIVWPFFTGSENWVEITATHDNATDNLLYIPGGNAGYTSFPPMLTIVYLGALEGPPDFFFDA